VASLVAEEAPSWWSFRSRRWKYVLWPDEGNGTQHEELFDLDNDEDELVNLISSEVGIANWLRSRLRFARSIPDGARVSHFS